METRTDNEIIAEFMGLKSFEDSRYRPQNKGHFGRFVLTSVDPV